jgi:Domain of unknown function (DUF4288)
MITVDTIPKDARWYYADIVLEFRIEDDPRNVVHVNTVLVEADSEEHAYHKANEIGQREEDEYTNRKGKRVLVIFRGLKSLDVIHDELADGAELFYDERVDLAEDDVSRLIKPKHELNVFAPRSESANKPDYLDKTISDLLAETGWSGNEPADGSNREASR